MTLGTSTTLAASTVTFDSSVDSTDFNEGLTVTGDAKFGGAAGPTNGLNYLSVSGNAEFDSGYLGGALTIGGTTTFNSSAEIFSSGGDQTYTGAVILGADTNLGTFEGNVNFQSTVSGPHALAINTISDGTTTTFGGEVGVGTNNALTSLSITGTSTINTDAIKTTGGQVYRDVVTLGANTTLTDTSTSGVEFDRAVNGTTAGAQSLTIDGNARFDGIVGGGSTPLSALSVTGTANFQNVGTYVGTTNIDGGTGNQTYGGAVFVGDINFASTGGTVDFQSTLDNRVPGIISADVTVSGNAEFDGNVGSTGPLSSLDVTGTSPSPTGSRSRPRATRPYWRSDARQRRRLTTYTFKSTGGTVDFQGGVDGTVAGEESLAVTGNAEFDTSVGSNVALGSLSVSGTTVLSDAVSVTTTNSDGASGNQTYTGDVSLGNNLNDTYTFNSTGGLVDFGGKVNGTFSGEEVLVVNGNAEFDSTVGSSGVPLNSVFVGGTTKFDGTVTTTGDQTYTGAVTLNTDETLTSTAGSIAFGSTVDAASAGGEALTVDATAGTTTFGGNVGAGEALKSLSVDTGSLSIGGNITTENDLSLDVVGARPDSDGHFGRHAHVEHRQHHARD